MKKFILLLPICFCFGPMHSQTFTPDLKKLSDYEIKLTKCEFEPEANAIKLMDYEELDVDGDFEFSKIKIFRKVRIKILNEKGKNAANIIIPYFSRYTLSNLKAQIYNPDADGNMVATAMGKEEFFNDDLNNNVKSLRFAFPDVRQGSIVEYSYTRIIKNTLQIEPWFFQDNLPVLYSSCRISYPKELAVGHTLIKTDSVEESMYGEVRGLTLTRQVIFNRFTLRNIPSFKKEPLMSSATDNLQRIEYSISPNSSIFSYVLANARYWQIFNYILNNSTAWGGQIKKTIKGTERIIDSARKIQGPADKVSYICSAIKSNVVWDKIRVFYPGDLQLAWDERLGSNMELNMLLLNLLKKAGVDCYPMIISTRDHGIVRESFNSISQFNGMIVLAKTGDQYSYFDLTQKHFIPAKPPIAIYDRDALILDSAEAAWTHLYEDKPIFRRSSVYDAKINPDGILDGKAEVCYYDFSKIEKLDLEESSKKSQKQDEFIHEAIFSVSIDSAKLENKNNDTIPLLERFHFKTEFAKAGNYIEFNPVFAVGFPENVFRSTNRSTAIDFIGNHEYEVKMRVELPKGITVESTLPDTAFHSDDNMLSFQEKFQLTGNNLDIAMKFEIRQPYFAKELYNEIKTFFENYSKSINESIILKVAAE